MSQSLYLRPAADHPCTPASVADLAAAIDRTGVVGIGLTHGRLFLQTLGGATPVIDHRIPGALDPFADVLRRTMVVGIGLKPIVSILANLGIQPGALWDVEIALRMSGRIPASPVLFEPPPKLPTLAESLATYHTDRDAGARDGTLGLLTLDNAVLAICVAIETAGLGIALRRLRTFATVTERTRPPFTSFAAERRQTPRERLRECLARIVWRGRRDLLRDLLTMTARSNDGRLHLDPDLLTGPSLALRELARDERFRACIEPAPGRVLVCGEWLDAVTDPHALKRSLTQVHAELARCGAQIVFAFDGEVLVEAPTESAAEVRTLVERVMRKEAEHIVSVVPVVVDVAIRSRWADEVGEKEETVSNTFMQDRIDARAPSAKRPAAAGRGKTKGRR